MQEEAAAAKGSAKGGSAKGAVVAAAASGEGEAASANASDAPAEAAGGSDVPGAAGGVAAQAPPRPAVVIRKKCGFWRCCAAGALAGRAPRRDAHAAARRQERHGGASARRTGRRAGVQESQRYVRREANIRVRLMAWAGRGRSFRRWRAVQADRALARASPLASRLTHIHSGRRTERGRGRRLVGALFGRDAQVPITDGRENKHRRTPAAQMTIVTTQALRALITG